MSFGTASGQLHCRGRATEWKYGVHQTTNSNQTPNTIVTIPGVSLRVITFVDERETPQTAS